MIHESQFLSPGDILIHDAEPALCTPTVEEYLRNHGIQAFVLPTALHQFLSPCDNNFHSIFKLAYYRLVSEGCYTSINIEEKLVLAKMCYDQISSDVISSLFVTCGLVGTEDKHGLVSRLMCEGLKLLGHRDSFHKNNLVSFLSWCLENGLNDLCRYEFDFSLLG